MRRLVLLLALAAALGACDLDEHPPDVGPVVVPDVTDAGGGEPDVAVDPVSCDFMDGQWQVTLCGANAATVQFIRAGCQASLSSNAPALNGGTALLRDGVRLELSLPGGTAGALACEATPTTASFQGICTGATGSCPIAGVKLF